MNVLGLLWNYLPWFIQNHIKRIFAPKHLSFSYIKHTGIKEILLQRNKNITIGEYSYLSTKYISAMVAKVTIWKHCSIAGNVCIVADRNHEYDCLTTYPRSFRYLSDYPGTWADIIIGHDVWIGANAVIRYGVKIWIGAVIGAGSVVVKDIPPYAIVAWNPATIIKYRFDPEIIEKLLKSKWRNRDEEKIKKNYNLEFLRKE
jgi:acetyltransferase-like isoleucine patch superfamily enzyme